MTFFSFVVALTSDVSAAQMQRLLTVTCRRLLGPASGGSALQGLWHTQLESLLTRVVACGFVGELFINMSAIDASSPWNGQFISVAVNNCQEGTWVMLVVTSDIQVALRKNIIQMFPHRSHTYPRRNLRSSHTSGCLWSPHTLLCRTSLLYKQLWRKLTQVDNSRLLEC